MSSPRELIRKHQLTVKKRWGQCFLHDRNIVQRIVDAAGLNQEDVVLEIGPGLGILTVALAQRVSRLVAIERDPDLVPVLRQAMERFEHVTLVQSDALICDFRVLFQKNSSVKVVGNLPYNISSPLIFKLLENHQWVTSATLMLQKEVGTRICAKPGTKDYGAPSVICQQYATVHPCFHVGRGAFEPAPRVDSTVIRLDMRPTPRWPTHEITFRKLVRAAFAQRRKTLNRALLSEFSADAVRTALEQCSIEGQRRGETLSVEEFAKLARALSRSDRGTPQ